MSLVPTPSVEATRSGSTKPAAVTSNRPAKPPRPDTQPGTVVARASGVMAFTRHSPAAMLTPQLS